MCFVSNSKQHVGVSRLRQRRDSPAAIAKVNHASGIVAVTDERSPSVLPRPARLRARVNLEASLKQRVAVSCLRQRRDSTTAIARANHASGIVAVTEERSPSVLVQDRPSFASSA